VPVVVGRLENLAIPVLLCGIADQRFGIHVELLERRTLYSIEFELKVEISEVPPIGVDRCAPAQSLRNHVDPHVGRIGQYLTARRYQASDLSQKTS